MYKELYGYLVIYKQLSVPGIGTFLLNRAPVEIDFPNKLAHPSIYSVSLASAENKIDPDFYHQLSAIIDKSASDTVKLFNDFAFDLVNSIKSGAEVRWNNVGKLSRSLDGAIRFTNPEINTAQLPVTAEKVLRENAGHMVRVGEDQRTSEQMTQFLSDSSSVRNHWLLIAISIAILAFIFIGWHFSQNGVGATANMNKKNPASPPASTYKILSQP